MNNESIEQKTPRIKVKWCKKCNKKLISTDAHNFLSLDYCKKCYIKEKFGTDNLDKYLKQNNIKFQETPYNTYMINRGRNNIILLEFIDMLEAEYWFGKGEFTDTLYIEKGNTIQKK